MITGTLSMPDVLPEPEEYPRVRMASSTLLMVSAFTKERWFSTRETVAGETPA